MSEIARLAILIVSGLSIVCALGGLYQLAMSFLSLCRLPAASPVAPRHRFTILVPARNEAMVIGPLVDSLMRLNYPRELYQVVVVPNNCTDRTEAVALEHGARIFTCMAPVRTKGQALHHVFDHLPNELRADAYCIFDADNVVHPDFLLHMNRSLCSGYQVAQGYRDSKNPYDTIISSCASIFYIMNNRYYCHPRGVTGVSAALNGTAFMVSDTLLRKLGGWCTHTLTEDIEFSLQSVLAGEKIAWVPEALTFDEQPMTFIQSWKQRKRWSIGVLQSLARYMVPLMRRFIAKPDKVLADTILYCLCVLLQYIGYPLSLAGLLLRVFAPGSTLYPLMLLTGLLLPTSLLFLGSTTVAAFLATLMERKVKPGILKGIFMYWFYIASWIPINLIALLTFRNNQSWDPIHHTRAIQYKDLQATARK